MPQHLDTGFEQLPVMKDFVWVVVDHERVVGALLAAPCHGLIFFVRIRTEPDAPPMAVPLLFRHAVKDCVKRGFKGYFTYIDPTRSTERSFVPICRKAGGIQISSLQVGLVGKLEDAARY